MVSDVRKIINYDTIHIMNNVPNSKFTAHKLTGLQTGLRVLHLMIIRLPNATCKGDARLCTSNYSTLFPDQLFNLSTEQPILALVFYTNCLCTPK
jgi:hypothetical protein